MTFLCTAYTPELLEAEVEVEVEVDQDQGTSSYLPETSPHLSSSWADLVAEFAAILSEQAHGPVAKSADASSSALQSDEWRELVPTIWKEAGVKVFGQLVLTCRSCVDLIRS